MTPSVYSNASIAFFARRANIVVTGYIDPVGPKEIERLVRVSIALKVGSIVFRCELLSQKCYL